MPHFTVVPVKDQAPSSYDSLEGLNWVDHRDAGLHQNQNQDTVSSDGESHSDSEALGLVVGVKCAVKFVWDQPGGLGRRVALCVAVAAPLPWRLNHSAASCSPKVAEQTFLILSWSFSQQLRRR